MSGYRHLLLGVDLSSESAQVVERAKALRDAFGSELSVIHVIEPLSFAYGGDIPMDFSGIQEEIHKQARAHMTSLCEPLGIPESNRHLVVGRPETEIHHIAEEIGADFLASSLQYGPTDGMGELREQIAKVMADEGAKARVDDIMITTGGQQAIDLSIRTFVDRGDTVMAEGPTYPGAAPR